MNEEQTPHKLEVPMPLQIRMARPAPLNRKARREQARRERLQAKRLAKRTVAR